MFIVLLNIMGRGKKCQKKHLCFRALKDSLASYIEKIPDKRQPWKTDYSLHDAYMSGFAMFYLQDKALLEFQRRFQDEIQQNNLATVFDVKNIPGDTQLRTIIDIHSYEPIMSVFSDYFKRLQRDKTLMQYQFLDGKYLITVDGSEYFTSESINCVKCLRKKSKDGIRYHHQILQATLVHPDSRVVIPLSPEFIRNTDGEKKQDCERNAAKRMLKRIKADHKMLPIIIVGDGLYSNQPFVEELYENNFSYILVAKPKDHKYLFEDIEGFRKMNTLNKYDYIDRKGRKHIYEWVNKVALNGNKNPVYVNYAEYSLIVKGKRTYHNSWVTDIEITKDNVCDIVRGGRARWKIENETFNTLKNHGYHLEHNFGHGENNLSEAFFLLNLIAFLIHQIFQLTDFLYQECRLKFSARIEYWNVIRSSFRLFIFSSWLQVLERINSPPQPIF